MFQAFMMVAMKLSKFVLFAALACMSIDVGRGGSQSFDPASLSVLGGSRGPRQTCPTDWCGLACRIAGMEQL